MNWLDVFGRIEAGRGGDTPIYMRIVESVRQAIEAGELKGEARLPTNRELAAFLAVDRSTVARAYLELTQMGLIESHVGRGTFVRGAKGAPAAVAPQPAMTWTDKYSRGSSNAADLLRLALSQPQEAPAVISFAGGIPTQEFFPQAEFEEIVAAFNSGDGLAEMFAYSPAEGHPALRAEVIAHLASEGMSVRAEELLIVSGSQQAIDIVARALIDPGDVVVVEEPTYLWAKCIFSSLQARCLPVPVDAEGMRIDLIESLLSRNGAKLIYLMPSFQNPTGCTLSLSRRTRLLELAAHYQVPILEDNFVGDLRYDGEPLPTLWSLDSSRSMVVHQGTFSKALCPGLRLGWLVAPAEVMSRLSLAKRASDLSTNSMAQIVMAEFLRRGHYRRHLDAVRSAYRRRRDTMCDALAGLAGGKVSWTKPEGGLFVWAKLADGLSSRELIKYAEREGVSFSPGDMYFVQSGRQEYMRLSFIQLDCQTIAEGVARLARAIDAYLESRAAVSGPGQSSRRPDVALI